MREMPAVPKAALTKSKQGPLVANVGFLKNTAGRIYRAKIADHSEPGALGEQALHTSHLRKMTGPM